MATAKQLAARKKFAEMARSGAFKRKAAASKRKPRKLPEPDVIEHHDRSEYEDAVRKRNPKKRTTNRTRIESKAAQVSTATGRAATVYILESSKDGKHWKFVDVYAGPGTAKQRAEMMADEYPSAYWRVRSETVKK